ncbi:MAG: choice-of-anchor L domain-containing protein [Cyanobacteriota bacterium]
MPLSRFDHSFPADHKSLTKSPSGQLDGKQSKQKNMLALNLNLRQLLPAIASLALFAGEAKALTVAPSTDFNALANFLLVPGWNPVPGSVSGTLAGPNAIGTFDNATDIGLTNGVLLTTGTVLNALGPNSSSSATGPGALSSLSFDFVAVSPGISWRYVFASEEYEEYVGSQFNDRFRLTLNGENLALIPGTSANVEINSVNQSSNSAFYRSNVGTALNNFNTQYDGLTTLLTASKGDLVVGDTYTVEFMITDIGDQAWDSGVFIGANSVVFEGGSPETPLMPETPSTPTAPWVFPEFEVFDTDFTWWLDPDVAVGYIYNVTGGPKFATYEAPTLPFDNDYELFGSSDSCSTFTNSLGLITGGNQFSFGTAVDCFAIKGIDVANMLDPTDTMAFVAGVTFDSTGLVNVTQTPITVFVDPATVPGPLPLFGVGAALAWSRRLRQRINA